MAGTDAMPRSRAELEQKIVALAWKDEAFRKAFLANPKAEFEKRLGTKLPAGLTIAAYAEDADHLHFVIPAAPKGTVGELSDADLEKMAGGVDFVTISVVLGSVGMGLGMTSVVATTAQAIGPKDARWIQ